MTATIYNMCNAKSVIASEHIRHLHLCMIATSMGAYVTHNMWEWFACLASVHSSGQPSNSSDASVLSLHSSTPQPCPRSRPSASLASESCVRLPGAALPPRAPATQLPPTPTPVNTTCSYFKDMWTNQDKCIFVWLTYLNVAISLSFQCIFNRYNRKRATPCTQPMQLLLMVHVEPLQVLLMAQWEPLQVLLMAQCACGEVWEPLQVLLMAQRACGEVRWLLMAKCACLLLMAQWACGGAQVWSGPRRGWDRGCHREHGR